MIDVDDGDGPLFVVDAVEHPILATARTPHPAELLAEWLAHMSRPIEKVTAKEVEDGGSH
jgi:hypothetical protein